MLYGDWKNCRAAAASTWPIRLWIKSPCFANTPPKVWGARSDSKCQTVKRGYWPTEALMTKAGAQRGHANRISQYFKGNP